ncbi:mRNA interferase MazF [Ruaniaceae bacterium KH17]|nr:mRNA interferase MazF [Ruaniaceae bacterium KH17]
MTVRGEIWTVAGGVYASKPRPALIIQDDLFGDTDSVTVLPMTSHYVEAPLLRMQIEPDRVSGLGEMSWVMVDKLTTVRRSSVGRKIGRVSSTQLVEVERLLMLFLGIAT